MAAALPAVKVSVLGGGRSLQSSAMEREIELHATDDIVE
jgi:hypothetical protein